MDKFVPLNENKDFRRIYAKGKSYVSSSVITYVSKNRCKQIRVGITTSKKIGNAVQRNRARRLIRESVRHLTEDIKDGYDLVFVARAKTPQVKSTQLMPVLKKQILSLTSPDSQKREPNGKKQPVKTKKDGKN